jgi:hypothetical protein
MLMIMTPDCDDYRCVQHHPEHDPVALRLELSRQNAAHQRTPLVLEVSPDAAEGAREHHQDDEERQRPGRAWRVAPVNLDVRRPPQDPSETANDRHSEQAQERKGCRTVPLYPAGRRRAVVGVVHEPDLPTQPPTGIPTEPPNHDLVALVRTCPRTTSKTVPESRASSVPDRRLRSANACRRPSGWRARGSGQSVWSDLRSSRRRLPVPSAIDEGDRDQHRLTLPPVAVSR